MDSYETRLEVLKLAKEILVENSYLERQRLDEDWRSKVIDADLINTARPPYPEIKAINYEEILKIARELDNFVSNLGYKRTKENT